ncbi:hypothetical protein M441DRAFT_401405 [Trichoderma asperellum CBS 433.97]|uniref:Uncharacterized protein n=1 Tax=Trichoderma asperellum (strain ATCC 204424 / CBS 433.97 / NBRC 101777) TaxID=1042311 RepID=A0A2T3Z9W1_TRIA4|nr:hypothetical protein M441DRAFT_401405 [Trichoderma asperellum CBS 433.97]PTB41594.1 hypothetical protein M441DRAFT_401405 [Trichoderma asperellum CBS 433.97]
MFELAELSNGRDKVVRASVKSRRPLVVLLSYSQRFGDLTAPRFCLCPRPSGCNQSSCQDCQICEEDASKHSKGPPIGLPHALNSALRCLCCSLGRSAVQASCSRNLSKLDVCQGAAAHTHHTCQAALVAAWQRILASQHLEAEWPTVCA